MINLLLIFVGFFPQIIAFGVINGAEHTLAGKRHLGIEPFNEFVHILALRVLVGGTGIM